MLERLEGREMLNADSVYITEFMASNATTIFDRDRQSSDWVEIFNDSNSEVDLTRWSLTDDPETLDKWQFPAGTTIGPKEFLVVFASGENKIAFGNEIHASFQLSSAGEYLALINSEGLVEQEFAPAFPPQLVDVSYGLAMNPTGMSVVGETSQVRVLVPSDDSVDNQWMQTDFDDSLWQQGQMGVGYEARPEDFADLIETQLPARTVTAYVRTTFNIENPADVGSLLLQLKYDDGFVAYINGVQVASANAPQDARWDSTSTASHLDSLAVEYEDFPVNAPSELLKPGENVLAIHMLNSTPASTDMLMSAQLFTGGAGLVSPLSIGYLTEATPGEPNTNAVQGVTSGVEISLPRGFYFEPIEVTLSTSTLDAQIFYTLDGSDPNGRGRKEYTGPLTVLNTTTVRAVAVKQGFRPSSVATATYLYIADVARQPALPRGLPANWAGRAADYEVDPEVTRTTLPGFSLQEALLSIPSLSISTNPDNLFSPSRGIYYNSSQRGPNWERPASAELIFPDGREGFQIDAGIRMHGNSSRQHGFTPKHPFRLLFQRKFGPAKLKYPLFADSNVTEFDQLVLRAPSTDSWSVVEGGVNFGTQRWSKEHATFIRDQLMRDAMLALGQPSARGTYVHLYLNGLYWGLYNIAERPTDSFNASYLGGEPEEYDVLKDFAEIVSGNKRAWNSMMSLARSGLSSDAAYQRIQGNNPDGTRNPDFPVYLNMDNFIDYMILHISAGAEDWPNHNYWAARRRGDESEGFRFFAWDQGISNDSLTRTHTLFGQRFAEVSAAESPAILYDRLRRNPTFSRRFGDRVQELLFNGGPLSPQGNEARRAARAGEINQAVVADSARWGDAQRARPYKREVEWLREQNWMRDVFWEANHNLALTRFRSVDLFPDIDAPTFSQHGGTVGKDFRLFMSAPTGDIYFTTDGSDPMLPDGQIAPTAQAFAGFFTPLVSKGSDWQYWDQGGISNPAWKEVDFDDSTWKSGPAQLGYGDGDEATLVGFGDDIRNRHISTYFRQEFLLDDRTSVDGLRLRLLRDDGAVVYLNGEEIVRSNMPDGIINADTESAGPAGRGDDDKFFEFTVPTALLRDGKNVIAVEVHQVSKTSADLSFDLELLASTTLLTPRIDVSESTTVKSRALSGDTWSALNKATFTTTQAATSENLAISEINYHPSAPTDMEVAAGVSNESDFEYIELRNIGENSIDLQGLQFTRGLQFEFTIDTNSVIRPGEYLLVVQDAEAFSLRYGDGLPIAGTFIDGRLNNAGEVVELSDGQGNVILQVEYGDRAPWPSEPDGGGYSLERTDVTLPASDPLAWSASVHLNGSPGRDRFFGADPNGDGEIDLDDFETVKSNFGLTSANLSGDVNGDGRIDLIDFAIFKNIFGSSSNATGEPSDSSNLSQAPLAQAAMTDLVMARQSWFSF